MCVAGYDGNWETIKLVEYLLSVRIKGMQEYASFKERNETNRYGSVVGMRYFLSYAHNDKDAVSHAVSDK